jgi:hypothetical protein
MFTIYRRLLQEITLGHSQNNKDLKHIHICKKQKIGFSFGVPILIGLTPS